MSSLRRLVEDFREFPATMALATAWVLIFAWMAYDQYAQGGSLNSRALLMGLGNGHKFGDLTLAELYSGELWRTVTATFVHYGILHIGMNLFALYQLGCLVESWYGAGPFLALYVLTGGGGNLLSGMVRQALHSSPTMESGGGSTVIMGLVAICAVVGWRSKTPIGALLKNQMLWVIATTAGLGIALSLSGLPVIDNWGHAGGTVMGALLGLGSRGMVRHAGGLLARGSGWFGASILAASFGSLVVDHQAEAQLRQRIQLSLAEQSRQRRANDERLITRLDEITQIYNAVATPRLVRRGMIMREPPKRVALPAPLPTTPSLPPPSATNVPPPQAPSAGAAWVDPENELWLTVLKASFISLQSMSGDLDQGLNAADFRRVRQILGQSLIDPPTLEELREFERRMKAINERLQRDRLEAGSASSS